MEKGVLLFAALLILLPLISAINLDVTAKPVSDAVITDLNQPATFDLMIKNNGESDVFTIYSLVGVDITPENLGTITMGETKTIPIQVVPQSAIKERKGYFTFEYLIKNEKSEVQKQSLTIHIVDLSTGFEIVPSPINPKSDQITIQIKNRIMKDFPQLKIKMTSAFFSYDDTIDIKSNEIKEISIPVDKEKVKGLNAGDFLLSTTVETDGKTGKIDSIIKFLEQEDIETKETKEGIIIQRDELSKKNVGNTRKTVTIQTQKNLIAYLFTTVNIPPTTTRTEGFKKIYIWEKEILPNDELDVIVKTNWLFPFIIILLAAGIIYVIRRTVETDLILRKDVSFVKTIGGEFALKISLKLKAKKHIDKIKIVDKLPGLVKLYDKFGSITPTKVDLANRKIEWDLESLNPQEERFFSYIIYSKVGVVGKFGLPEARVSYEKEGKAKHATSNKSFFVNERPVNK